MYELGCEILVNIPAPKLNFPQVLSGKEGGIVKKIYELSILSDLVKIKPKHAKGIEKMKKKEIKKNTKCIQSLLTFSYVFFFLSFWQGVKP